MKHLILFIGLILFSSKTYDFPIELKNGDLLFVGETSTSLSNAISEVTQTKLKTQYSHMGIIEKSDETYYFLHASTENGTERIPLIDFLQSEREHSNVFDVYRIKPEYHVNIQQAILNAKDNLGKPYNFTYILSDSAYYCSDFVLKAFAKDSVFNLNKMTFKNPGETDFNKGWIDYYKKLNLEIPEGELGCNPNGMAASEKLIKVGSL